MLRPAPPVLPFPARRRPVKAQLTPQVAQNVQEIIALAPLLGVQHPEGTDDAVDFIRALMPDPPQPPDPGILAPLGLAVNFPAPFTRRTFLPPVTDLDQPHFLMTPEMIVFMVSDTLEAALGMGQREFRRHWREHLEVADTAALQRDFEQAVATQEGFSERIHWRMADGALRGSTLRITPRVFHDQFVGFTGVLIFDRAA